MFIIKQWKRFVWLKLDLIETRRPKPHERTFFRSISVRRRTPWNNRLRFCINIELEVETHIWVQPFSPSSGFCSDGRINKLWKRLREREDQSNVKWWGSPDDDLNTGNIWVREITCVCMGVRVWVCIHMGVWESIGMGGWVVVSASECEWQRELVWVGGCEYMRQRGIWKKSIENA